MKYSGGRKVREDERQAEAHTGRKQNLNHKRDFRAGAFVKNDPNAGRVQPLVAERQNAAPPKKAGTNR